MTLPQTVTYQGECFVLHRIAVLMEFCICLYIQADHRRRTPYQKSVSFKERFERLSKGSSPAFNGPPDIKYRASMHLERTLK